MQKISFGGENSTIPKGHEIHSVRLGKLERRSATGSDKKGSSDFSKRLHRMPRYLTLNYFGYARSCWVG